MANDSHQRNVTKLQNILRSAQHVSSGQDDDVGQYVLAAAPYDAAIRILTAMDARTGKLDPRLRGRKSGRKSPARGSSKARRR